MEYGCDLGRTQVFAKMTERCEKMFLSFFWVFWYKTSYLYPWSSNIVVLEKANESMFCDCLSSAAEA